MNQFPLPPLIAILVGINEYSNYSNLTTAAADVDRVKDFLTTEFQNLTESSITVLKDSDATRHKIIDTLSSLQDKPQRNNAILFFFFWLCWSGVIGG
jgi:hypothetical protein